MGGPYEEIERHSLAINQVCGVELDAVLAAHRNIAATRGRLEDRVPLGAVLADLERFAGGPGFMCSACKTDARSPVRSPGSNNRWALKQPM
jgi:hypothetical protein